MLYQGMGIRHRLALVGLAETYERLMGQLYRRKEQNAISGIMGSVVRSILLLFNEDRKTESLTLVRVAILKIVGSNKPCGFESCTLRQKEI